MPAVRIPATQRRVEVVEVATREFAKGGMAGTPTEIIARKAGISHAYLFRLFPTKKTLFVACVDRAFDRTLETFAAAVDGETIDERLEAMGKAYADMLSDRELLLAQLHAYAACGDDDIRARVRERFSGLLREIARLSGAPAERVQSFVAHGMLLNVVAAMQAPELIDEAAWRDAC